MRTIYIVITSEYFIIYLFYCLVYYFYCLVYYEKSIMLLLFIVLLLCSARLLVFVSWLQRYRTRCILRDVLCCLLNKNDPHAVLLYAMFVIYSNTSQRTRFYPFSRVFLQWGGGQSTTPFLCGANILSEKLKKEI